MALPSVYKIKIDEHLMMRMGTLQDKKELFELIRKNKKHLGPWLDWVAKNKEVKDSAAYIARTLKEYEDGVSCKLGLYYDNVLIGMVGFVRINKTHKQADIGYWVGKEYEGKGHMSKAVEKLIAVGQKKYKLHRIVIGVNTENVRSRAIPERLGFHLEATLKDARFDAGRFQDAEIWTLLTNKK